MLGADVMVAQAIGLVDAEPDGFPGLRPEPEQPRIAWRGHFNPRQQACPQRIEVDAPVGEDVGGDAVAC